MVKLSKKIDHLNLKSFMIWIYYVQDLGILTNVFSMF